MCTCTTALHRSHLSLHWCRMPSYAPRSPAPAAPSRSTCSNLEPNVYSYTALLALPRHMSEAAAPELLDQVGAARWVGCWGCWAVWVLLASLPGCNIINSSPHSSPQPAPLTVVLSPPPPPPPPPCRAHAGPHGIQ